MTDRAFNLSDGPLLDCAFVGRPNRFLVRCRLSGGREVEAFLPNPGRLLELLLPDARIWLQETRGAARLPGVPGRTRFAALAVERDGRPICLDTRLAPRVAVHLIHAGLIPRLTGARVLRHEVASGHSRFDLLLERAGEQVITEVKSVTLYGNGVAMFPDAITERGRRHFEELAALSKTGRRVLVIFIVHTAGVRWFMPDYHTDFEFARVMLATRHEVEVLPLAVSWRGDLSLRNDARLLTVPWGFLDREAQDRGAYLLILRLDRARQIEVGSLGPIVFQPGHYVYVGSAMQNLTARIDRHLRRRKTHRWHIDYLRASADSVRALPVRTSARIEQALARALGRVLPPGPTGFGAADSAEATHLFHSPRDPLLDRRFHDLLQAFRMRAP